MEPLLENIKPLIKKELNQGMQFIVHFQADNQLTPIQGVAAIMPDQNQLMKNVTKQATKTAVKTSIISIFSRFIGGLIGGRIGNEVGYATSSVASTVVNKPMDTQSLVNTEMTEEKRHELILMAFKTVQSYFKWDEETKKWIGTTQS